MTFLQLSHEIDQTYSPEVWGWLMPMIEFTIQESLREWDLADGGSRSAWLVDLNPNHVRLIQESLALGRLTDDAEAMLILHGLAMGAR